MPGKRSTTPLFEVLQESQAAAGLGGRSGPSADPQPQPVATSDTPTPQPSPLEPQGGFSDAPIRIVGGVVQMPMVYAAVALAVAIGLILGAWTLGYQRGESQAAARAQLLESAIGSGGSGGGGRVVEPETRSANTAGRDAGTPDRPSTRPPGSSDASSGTPSIGTAAFLTPTGPTQTDPRQDRYNYLQLGSSIRVSEMRSIMELMASRGLDCFGVVDPGSRRRNDGPLYVLFAGRGFPSGQANSSEAVRYREQVLAAGAAWKKTGGVKDFNDAVWVLYKQ